MPEDKQKSASLWKVQVAGVVVEPGTMASALVEDSTHLPDMCVLTYQDQAHDVIANGKFEIGKEMKVLVFDETNTGGKPLFSGEITALESAFENGKSYAIVRGFDKAHRLYRGRKTKVFVDVKYSDVVKQVAQDAGLSCDTIDQTAGKPKAYVAQVNQSDAEFLKMLAGESGFILLVQDGKVNFKKPTKADDAPAPADFGAQGPLALVPGQDVLRYSAIITADSQVSSVEVRGWDTKGKRLVKSTAPAATTSASVGVKPADLAAKFGSPVFHAVDVPYGDQSETDAVAKALADQIASAHAQLEGVARGNIELRAGKAVSLGSAGKPFDGKYTLTSTRHTYDNGEYLTQFFSTGTSEKTLQSLMSAGGGGGGSSPAFVTAPIHGVVTGIVSDVNEAKDKNNDMGACRVKVKIEQFGDKFVTDWMQVAQAGVGKDRGSLMMPEVNDQVVVAFERGDIRRGFVLGGVYNGKDQPHGGTSKGVVSSDGKVDRRSFSSRAGSYLLMDDKSGAEHLTLATKDEKYLLQLDKGKTTIKIDSDGKIEIHGKQDILLKGDANVTLESKSNMTIKSGGGVSIQASGDISIKGTNVKAEASANADIKGGAQVNVKGAMATLEASGITTVKGSLVKIN